LYNYGVLFPTQYTIFVTGAIVMRLVEKLLANGKTILTEAELQQVIREADYNLFRQVVE